MNAIATISMLHESAAHNSATRVFRDQLVLEWTLERTHAARGLAGICVVCFDDQLEAITRAIDDQATAHSVGPRRSIATVDSITAARRWSDGWRGGLLNSTEFDLGFDGRMLEALAASHQADAVVLIDPAAGMIDPQLLTHLLSHAAAQVDIEFAFLPAAPGFGAMLIRTALLARLAGGNLTPGRLLSYQPDAPMRDPLGAASCAQVPLAVARTLGRFKLDSQSQIDRCARAWSGLNGQLIETSAERLIALAGAGEVGALPRDVVVELTTTRATVAIFSACRDPRVARAAMTLDTAQSIFEQMATRDDARITFAGVGDPMLHPHFDQIIVAAKSVGAAVHVETDLLPDDPASIDRLAASGIDVLSVHLPAMTPATYAAVMGVDALPAVIDNVKLFLTARARLGSATPILAPTFVKTKVNLAEMETWYDQWLRAVGTAVIAAPSSFGGAIEDVSVGDMSPPARVPCRRLADRMTILADGAVVSCEEDVLGRNVMGNIAERSIAEIWRGSLGRLRVLHADRQWHACALCKDCREWHRP